MTNSSHTFVAGDLVAIKQGTRAARYNPITRLNSYYILLDKLVKGVFLGEVPKEEEPNYDIMYLARPCRIGVDGNVLVIDARNINHYNKRRKNEKVD